MQNTKVIDKNAMEFLNYIFNNMNCHHMIVNKSLKWKL